MLAHPSQGTLALPQTAEVVKNNLKGFRMDCSGVAQFPAETTSLQPIWYNLGGAYMSPLLHPAMLYAVLAVTYALMALTASAH